MFEVVVNYFQDDKVVQAHCMGMYGYETEANLRVQAVEKMLENFNEDYTIQIQKM